MISNWVCQSCGCVIGHVVVGRLFIHGVQVVEGVIECGNCKRTRKFHKRRALPIAGRSEECPHGEKVVDALVVA